ncbi:MAG: hypothetical protein DRJ42_09660 [Deltaproteobacteria bacterium]|nr:MAG: hypothetical protein DRJ42_09660 [Deltaproteobacteria bacterium]
MVAEKIVGDGSREQHLAAPGDVDDGRGLAQPDPRLGSEAQVAPPRVAHHVEVAGPGRGAAESDAITGRREHPRTEPEVEVHRAQGRVDLERHVGEVEAKVTDSAGVQPIVGVTGERFDAGAALKYERDRDGPLEVVEETDAVHDGEGRPGLDDRDLGPEVRIRDDEGPMDGVQVEGEGVRRVGQDAGPAHVGEVTVGEPGDACLEVEGEGLRRYLPDGAGESEKESHETESQTAHGPPFTTPRGPALAPAAPAAPGIVGPTDDAHSRL